MYASLFELGSNLKLGIIEDKDNAKALSELPAEKVRHCWAPLQAAFDDMDTLHAKAASQLARLFPNMDTHVPDGEEEEPPSDADDDYEEPEPQGRDAQRRRAADERDGRAHSRRRHGHMAVAAGAPEQRPRRAAAAAANAAMDVLEQRGELA